MILWNGYIQNKIFPLFLVLALVIEGKPKHNQSDNIAEDNSPKETLSNKRDSSQDPPLYFEEVAETLPAGSEATIGIFLGSDSIPLNNFYAMAFTIHYDHSFIESGSIKFDVSGSWLGDEGDNLLMIAPEEVDESKVEYAITRTNEVGISGFGRIGTLKIKIKQQINDGSLNLTFQEVRIISFDDQLIEVNPGELEIPVDADSISVGVNENLPANRIKVYPNPVKDALFINSGNLEVKKASLINLQGKLIYDITNTGSGLLKVNLQELPAGTYFFRVETNDKPQIKRIAIIK